MIQKAQKKYISEKFEVAFKIEIMLLSLFKFSVQLHKDLSEEKEAGSQTLCT